MKNILLVPVLMIILLNTHAQVSSGNNVLNGTGVTAIQSITSSYKLSVGGAVKQFGTGNNGTSSPTLYLRNTTSGTGRNFGINSGDGGLFQVLDSNASNAIRLAINSSGNVGIGTTSPAAPLTVAGTNGDILIDTKRYSFNGVFGNGIWLNGSTTANDYNFLSGSADKNLYINRPSGKLLFIDEGDNEQTCFGTSGSLGLNVGFNAPNAKLEINTTTSNDGLYLRKDTNGFVRLFPNTLTASSYNPLVQSGDAGIIYGKSVQPSGSNSPFSFTIAPYHHNKSGLRMDVNGSVGIGTSNTSDTAYKLFVESGIRTRKIKVDLGTWSDYVFNNDYRLPTLAEVQQYIANHKHLPDVPSAGEVERNGLDLGENQAVLLRKIEELTLYMIEQDKKLEQLGSYTAAQDKKISDQQAQINELRTALKKK